MRVGFSVRNNASYMLNSIKICTLLIFLGIHCRFATEYIINALIFFNILQSGNAYARYDIHAPSIPDMYGDMITAIVFAIAYIFFISADARKKATSVPYNRREELGDGYLQALGQLKNHMRKTGIFSILPLVHLESVRQVKNYIQWTKGILFLGILAGFGSYLFSKYVLSIGLEVLFIENNSISFILNSINDVIKLCSSLVFAYVYCSYLSASKIITTALYIFLFTRNFFATNFIGLITEYDLHIVVPFLDILTPIIIFYSVGCIIISYRTTRLSKIIEKQNYYHYKIEASCSRYG